MFHNRRSAPSQPQLFDHARRLALSAGGKALILVNYDLDQPAPPGLVASRLYRGGDSIVSDESFRIYDVKVQ